MNCPLALALLPYPCMSTTDLCRHVPNPWHISLYVSAEKKPIRISLQLSTLVWFENKHTYRAAHIHHVVLYGDINVAVDFFLNEQCKSCSWLLNASIGSFVSISQIIDSNIAKQPLSDSGIAVVFFYWQLDIMVKGHVSLCGLTTFAVLFAFSTEGRKWNVAPYFLFFTGRDTLLNSVAGSCSKPLPINDTLCISKQQSPSFMARRKSYWRVCLGYNEVSGLPCLCWGDNILSSFGSELWTVNKTWIIHPSPMKSHMGLAGHLATRTRAAVCPIILV